MENPKLDQLTGLYDRAFAQAALDEAIAAARPGENIGFIYIDIDNLHGFNNDFGHQYGHTYLTLLARRIEAIAGANRILARVGGDEFCIVVPHAGTAETLELAERIRVGAAGVTLEKDEKTIGPLTLTIGVSCFPDDGDGTLKLLQEANLAVIIGKNHGKNCVLPARNPLRRDAPPY